MEKCEAGTTLLKQDDSYANRVLANRVPSRTERLQVVSGEEFRRFSL